MRRRFIALALVTLLVPAVAAAQAGRLELPRFAGLDKKATEAVDISLDGPMLELAGRFMSDADESGVKQLIVGLRGIYVRSYQFNSDNAYSKADVDAVRSQLSAPSWVRVVSVHDRKTDHDVDIYMRQSSSRMDGLAIIACEPRELTIVNIVGSIDLDKLRKLEGNFGVPKLDVPDAAGSK